MRCYVPLLLCIGGYLKSVLRYKFVILDTYHPDTLHLRQQGCEDPLLFFEAKKEVREQESLGNNSLAQCFSTVVRARPGKFFFHKTRARSQQIYSSIPFQLF